MLESKFYKTKVKKRLESWGYKVYRIETGGTAQAVPDVWATKEGSQIWVEMKSMDNRKKIVTPKWEPGQVAFGKMCIKHGQKWALMVMVGDRFMWTDVPKESYNIEELQEIT